MTGATGGCGCGAVRYRLIDKPMIVHCCHCHSCQRETGSAFVINAVIERDRLEVSGTAEPLMTPSASGQGQEIFRCPECRIALWSHYSGSGRKSAFVRVGTLDSPADYPPDVHIFTATRLPWVILPDWVPAHEEFYPDPVSTWTPAARHRWVAMLDG